MISSVIKNKLIIAVFFLLTLHSWSGAQTPCGEILIPSVEYRLLNQETKDAYLSLVTSDTYESAKRTASADVPGYFSGDYSEFKKKIASNVNILKFSNDRKLADVQFKSGISPEQVQAWSDCIANRPLILFPGRNMADKIFFQVKYNGAPGASTLVTLSFSGGPYNKAKQASVTLPSGGTAAFELQRETPASTIFVDGKTQESQVATQISFTPPEEKREPKLEIVKIKPEKIEYKDWAGRPMQLKRIEGGMFIVVNMNGGPEQKIVSLDYVGHDFKNISAVHVGGLFYHSGPGGAGAHYDKVLNYKNPAGQNLSMRIEQ